MPRVSVPRRMPRAYIHDWQQVARTQANIVNEEVVEEINPTEPGDSSISVRALLSRVTNKKDSTNEMSPPSHIFTTNLRSYQKQSLAFMISKETSANPSGWLASDVGMGKSAIVLALIASDSHSTSIGNFSNKLKATVVLTSVSLMGQWEDEAKKHAPGLVVRRFHPNSRSSVGLDLRDFYKPSIISALRGADLIITTASFQWPEKLTSLYEFHRIVMDESHLLSNSRSANVTWASQLRARRKWCVSATPCTASIVNLKSQMTFLGISNGSLFDCAFRKLENNRNTSSGQSTAAFQEFAEFFSTYVTRHDKAQLAGDGNALPSKTSKVVTLKMPSQEKVRYRNALGEVKPTSHTTNVSYNNTKVMLLQLLPWKIISCTKLRLINSSQSGQSPLK